MEFENEGRVLLLDDERLVRFTVSAWLKASHFEVTAVETPDNALRELRSKAYDVVLAGILIGDVDGFMFRDAVRDFNSQIPIIFLTALVSSPSNNLLDKIAKDPNSYYASKDSRRDLLLGRLRQVIAAYRAEREATALKERLDRELHIAVRVQHALLPPFTRYWDGIFYSGLWRPHNVVSGDLFCWFPQGESAAFVIVGDIAGHGTPAALAMTAVTAHLKELEHSDGVKTRSPELVCSEIHSYIRRNLGDVTYVAGTVLFIDMGRHFIRYLNAGGIEPLCFRRCDGTPVELNPNKVGCLPMGLVDEARYTADDVVEVQLPEDALVCLYTDGVEDHTSDAAGEERMPHDVFAEIIGEFIRGASGTSDVASLPYRLSAMLKDLGYVHAWDDESFWLIGAPVANAMRLLATVPMDSEDRCADVIDRASRWAASRGYSDDFIARIELLLLEHLENVRRHGLDEDGRRREMAVLEMRPSSDGLEIIAWDRGQAYEGDLSASAPHPDVTLDERNENLSANGRGLAILRKICRFVTYERFDILNKFVFVLSEQET